MTLEVYTDNPRHAVIRLHWALIAGGKRAESPDEPLDLARQRARRVLRIVPTPRPPIGAA